MTGETLEDGPSALGGEARKTSTRTSRFEFPSMSAFATAAICRRLCVGPARRRRAVCTVFLIVMFPIGMTLAFQDRILNVLHPTPSTWSGVGGGYDDFMDRTRDSRQIHCVITQFEAKQGFLWNELLKQTLGIGLFARERAVEATLHEQEGLIEWSVQVDLGHRICRTHTRWVNEQSVQSFLSDNTQHLRAMQHADAWVRNDTAVVASWTETISKRDEYQPGTALGEWSKAFDRLTANGETRY